MLSVTTIAIGTTQAITNTACAVESSELARLALLLVLLNIVVRVDPGENGWYQGTWSYAN